MRVGELCHREVVVVAETATVVEAAKLMRKHHVGDVIVVERDGVRDTPLGILTDRDVTVGVVARDADPSSFLVKDVIARELVLANETDEVDETMRLMTTQGIRRVPVVNKDGNLVGILALDDVLRWLAEQLVTAAQLTPRQQQLEAMKRLAR